MILSFSVFREKIESGEKKQTIRKFTEQKYKIAVNAVKYQLYWRNPRNGGTLIKEVERSIEPFLIGFQKGESPVYLIKDKYTLSTRSQHEIAIDDGFGSVKEMVDWFFEHYGEDMYTIQFIVFRWS